MEKLIEIQSKLKAPKNQRNSFGGYNYRSCEDILEAVKPLLKEAGALLTIADTIEQIGDRIYIKATATFRHGDFEISNTALAREPLTKKGMDDSQITGTASSYARKYALNGLFLIDDTKDADTDEHHRQTAQDAPQKVQNRGIDLDWLNEQLDMVDDAEGIDAVARETAKRYPNLTDKQHALIKSKFDKKRERISK